MQISQKLPQFNEEKALIIAAGSQQAKFYLANNGIIVKIESFKISVPAYFNKKEPPKIKGADKIFETGKIFKTKKEKIKQDFLKKLKQTAKEIIAKNAITDLYIFFPNYKTNEIKNALSGFGDKIIQFFPKSNYCDAHPFELLMKIKSKA